MNLKCINKGQKRPIHGFHSSVFVIMTTIHECVDVPFGDLEYFQILMIFACPDFSGNLSNFKVFLKSNVFIYIQEKFKYNNV